MSGPAGHHWDCRVPDGRECKPYSDGGSCVCQCHDRPAPVEPECRECAMYAGTDANPPPHDHPDNRPEAETATVPPSPDLLGVLVALAVVALLVWAFLTITGAAADALLSVMF